MGCSDERKRTLLGREYNHTITRDGDEIATGITETIYTDTDVLTAHMYIV